MMWCRQIIQKLFFRKWRHSLITTEQLSISLFERTISLLDKNSIAQKLHITIPENIHCVGYETNNQIKNIGYSRLEKRKGFIVYLVTGHDDADRRNKSDHSFYPLPNADSMITKNYFGDIPPERLQIKDSVLYFTCDGKYRSKIGLSPLIAKSIAASYDFKKNVLTLILFPVDENRLYVNSKWEMQKEPYKGDVVNSYNDGPLPDGSQLGPFYEIESSSSASELKEGRYRSIIKLPVISREIIIHSVNWRSNYWVLNLNDLKNE